MNQRWAISGKIKLQIVQGKFQQTIEEKHFHFFKRLKPSLRQKKS